MRINNDRDMANMTMNMDHIRTPAHGVSKSANAYFHFCQNARKEILEMKPGISQMELAKLLAERWTRLKPKEKEVPCVSI